ncbi:MAG: hypothetical protein ABI910_05030 [Gemmatimonadota bacterium]
MARIASAGILLVVVAFAAGSCVEAPATTSPDDAYESPLAEAFDALSRAASENGDLARSDGFAYAALSVRSGVTPSRLDVQLEDSIETYDAFVNTAWWDPALPTNVRPPARRTLVGWRKTDAGTTRVLALTSPSDSARILSPVALGAGVSTVAVYAAGSAMQNEGRDTPQGKPDIGSAWYGTSGWVKVAEAAVLGTCPDTVRHHDALGVSHCELARYRVAFDISMQHLTGRPPQLAAGTAVRRVATVEESLVNGLRLRFVCLTPSGEHGCR